MLCRNHSHVLGYERTRSFGTVAEAARALSDGSVGAVVGAIPFDVRESAALASPGTLRVHDGPWRPAPNPDRPRVQIDAMEPSPTAHRQRVAEAVATLTDVGNDLRKVVLARSVVVGADRPLTAWDLASALRAGDPRGSLFVTDLTPAGRAGSLVGASPEVLVRKDGARVSSRPLAGSAPRSADAAVDRERARALADSVKDHTEHRYVVEAIADALAPLCRRLNVPREPELMTTPQMWHLGTPIRGELHGHGLSALDLALAVHPTPAICGTPTAAARDHILATEDARGFYAGAVGWARAGDDGGDGEWMVAIRCAEIAGDGLTARTWAGGGIVADSDPDAELVETQAKLGTVLRALGVDSAASQLADLSPT